MLGIACHFGSSEGLDGMHETLNLRFGDALIASFAILSVYGQRFGVMVLGHLWRAWMSMVCIISCSSLICLSEMPFWWHAVTPTKVRPCPCCRHDCLHELEVKILLSTCSAGW